MGNIGLGLVFAGGGGKGAYEIGVWKYLHEVGLDQQVKAVSGTSVGALNAALFAGSSYENAEKLWSVITPSKILSLKKTKIIDIVLALISSLMPYGNFRRYGRDIVRSQGNIDIMAIANLLFRGLRSDAWFSRDQLMDMIRMGVDFSLMKARKIPCYATCLKCSSPMHPGIRVERFNLNNYDKNVATRILLASSAIPYIFPQEQIGKYKYCDGGVPFIGDNVPFFPIYELGAKFIIVVNLNKDSKPINKEKYPYSRIIEITPKVDLGNFFTGTLNFNKEAAMDRIQQGYNDAKNKLEIELKNEMINGEYYNPFI